MYNSKGPTSKGFSKPKPFKPILVKNNKPTPIKPKKDKPSA